jgi:hypothetical protein
MTKAPTTDTPATEEAGTRGDDDGDAAARPSIH